LTCAQPVRSHLAFLPDEREEIECYAKRVASRLHTVELNVRTVRDTDQEDHLHQINVFIDGLIAHPDPMMSRQKCQQFLYSCGFFDVTSNKEEVDKATTECSTSTDLPDILPIDKKFESALLGCTLDDQKIVRKRLQALLNYLIKLSISD
jgi:BCL2-associated athanogene 2